MDDTKMAYIVEHNNKEFRKLHGEPVQDRHSRFLVYADGAYSDSNPEGLLASPSNDPYEKQQVVVQYWGSLAAKARSVFTNKQKSLLSDASNVDTPPPFDEEIEVLEKLRNEARRLNKRCVKENDKLKALVPRSQRNRSVVDAELAQVNNDVGNRIQNIEI